MNDVQEINVDALMAQIREDLPKQPHTPAVGATTPMSNGFVTAELSSLQSNREIRYFHLTSHRQFLGSFVLLAKKVVRKLLTPSLERQSAYNAANMRLTGHLCERAEDLQKISQELTAQLREVHHELITQVQEVRHELTEQAEQRYQELSDQIGDVHQEQEAGLQAMRLELAEQIGGLHQEQAGAVQGLCGELTEQIASLQQDQAGGLQALRGELSVQMRETHQEHAAALQVLRGELSVQMRETHQEHVAALQVLRAQVVGEIEGVRREHTLGLQEVRERSSRAERRVRRFVAALTNGPNVDSPEVNHSLPPSKAVFEGDAAPDFDYFGFEERFRGSEKDIKERQRVYVEFFQEANQVLDIGCGRGEFLELLKEAGIKAKGVDLDLDMVLYCEEKRLDVVRQDAFTYLESLPDDSLGGLFAAQLVEHFEPSRISELVNLCRRKLQPGGVLIFETPNPACDSLRQKLLHGLFPHQAYPSGSYEISLRINRISESPGEIRLGRRGVHANSATL